MLDRMFMARVLGAKAAYETQHATEATVIALHPYGYRLLTEQFGKAPHLLYGMRIVADPGLGTGEMQCRGDLAGPDQYLADAFRKVLMRDESYVDVWVGRTDEESSVIIDGGCALTVLEAEAVEAVRELWRRAQR
jgi:hypothetical protein